MGEMEINNDCWSLTAVVKECAQKLKLKPQLTTETTLTPKTTANNSVSYELSSAAGAMNITAPAANSDSSELSSAAGAMNITAPAANSDSSELSLAAGVANITAPSVNNSSSKDELIELFIPFLAPNNNHYGPVFGGTNESPSNLVVKLDPSLQHHLRLRNFQKQGSSDHHCIDKKKKFEDRRVGRFTHEELARNDKWAWRKYGQKPIKGSPYPRNYYRCSSMKGCKARKQVEQSPIDPNFYIVTYTGHHFHPCPPIRNANGSRVKFSDPNPQLIKESPTSTVSDPIRHGYGSEFGGNVVKIEQVDEEVSGGTNDESFESGEMDESNDNNDCDILIPNLMSGMDPLMGMDLVNGSGGEIVSKGCKNYYYNENVGFDEKMLQKKRCDDQNGKMEVQRKENGFGFGLGIREKYGSAPVTLAGAHESPGSMAREIWGNGMIEPQAFFFLG